MVGCPINYENFMHYFVYFTFFFVNMNGYIIYIYVSYNSVNL